MSDEIDLQNYTIPDTIELKVSHFFRKVSLPLWSCRQYVNYYKHLNPHFEFSTLSNDFKSDLDNIKSCKEIPINVKRIVGEIKLKNKNEKGVSIKLITFINNDLTTFYHCYK